MSDEDIKARRWLRGSGYSLASWCEPHRRNQPHCLTGCLILSCRYRVGNRPSRAEAWGVDKLVGGAVLRLALGMLHKMAGDAVDEFPEALLPLLEIDNEGQKIELTQDLLNFVMKAFAAHNREIDDLELKKALQPISVRNLTIADAGLLHSQYVAP